MRRLARGAGGSILVAAAALVVAGCGSHKVPYVVGMRLDVAEKTLHDAGLGYKEEGGGIFGIVQRENWTVCRTDPVAGTSTGGDVKVYVKRICF